jgi:hypothetical protein
MGKKKVIQSADGPGGSNFLAIQDPDAGAARIAARTIGDSQPR